MEERGGRTSTGGRDLGKVAEHHGGGGALDIVSRRVVVETKALQLQPAHPLALLCSRAAAAARNGTHTRSRGLRGVDEGSCHAGRQPLQRLQFPVAVALAVIALVLTHHVRLCSVEVLCVEVLCGGRLHPVDRELH